MRRLWKDFYCILKPVLPQDDSCKGKISHVKALKMKLPPDKTSQVLALHEDLPYPWWFKEPHVRYLFDVVFIHPAQSLLSWSCQTGMFTRAPGPSSVTSVTAGSVNSTTWSITCHCTWKERRYWIIQLYAWQNLHRRSQRQKTGWMEVSQMRIFLIFFSAWVLPTTTQSKLNQKMGRKMLMKEEEEKTSSDQSPSSSPTNF